MRRFGGLRTGGVPASLSCRGIKDLEVRTHRGLRTCEPVSVKRTSQVSKISPTSVSILLICLSDAGWLVWCTLVYLWGRRVKGGVGVMRGEMGWQAVGGEWGRGDAWGGPMGCAGVVGGYEGEEVVRTMWSSSVKG